MTLTKGVAGGSCANATMKMLFMPDTGAIPKCDAALANMQTHVGCESINPLFVSLTHDAICTDAVSGLLSLFNTQVVAGVFMLFTLHYASFVRPYKNNKRLLPPREGLNSPSLWSKVYQLQLSRNLPNLQPMQPHPKGMLGHQCNKHLTLV